jgi:hypothetical protein
LIEGASFNIEVFGRPIGGLRGSTRVDERVPPEQNVVEYARFESVSSFPDYDRKLTWPLGYKEFRKRVVSQENGPNQASH